MSAAYQLWLAWAKRHPVRLTLASWFLGKEGYQRLDAAMAARCPDHAKAEAPR